MGSSGNTKSVNAGGTFSYERRKFPLHPFKKSVGEQGSRERSGCFAECAFAQLRKTSFARGEPGGADADSRSVRVVWLVRGRAPKTVSRFACVFSNLLVLVPLFRKMCYKYGPWERTAETGLSF